MSAIGEFKRFGQGKTEIASWQLIPMLMSMVPLGTCVPPRPPWLKSIRGFGFIGAKYPCAHWNDKTLNHRTCIVS
jgi:hypothetical protein